MSLAIGVDIGGTKVAAGVVDESGQVLAVLRRRTPSDDPAHLADVVVDVVGQLRRNHEVVAVGVGAAGLVDAARAKVVFAANLAWRDAPLREQIGGRLDVPVIIENDANAAAWGEFRFGAGDEEPDVVVLTIGTGIGGGLILNGALQRGRFGMGGEPGHVRMVPDGRLCGCGQHGCFEQYCSGKALVKAARDLVVTRPADGARLLELAQGDIANIDGPVVTSAAQEGDLAAIECFNEIGHWLGQGLADLASLLDPGRFVIGGGVADAGELLLSAARENYARRLSGGGSRPLADVVLAQLGAQAGLIGAADLARQS